MARSCEQDGVIDLMRDVCTSCLRLHVETKKKKKGVDGASELFPFLRNQAAALFLSSNPQPHKQLPLFPFSPPPSLSSRPFLIKSFPNLPDGEFALISKEA